MCTETLFTHYKILMRAKPRALLVINIIVVVVVELACIKHSITGVDYFVSRRFGLWRSEYESAQLVGELAADYIYTFEFYDSAGE